MHDPDTVERTHSVPEDMAHAPDLSIPTLRQDDAEPCGAQSLNLTGLRPTAQNHDSPGHPIEERLIEGSIHRHFIFPFMTKLRPKNLVDDIPVVRQENEPRRVFVETADREDAFRVADRGNNVARHVGFARRRHPDRFVVLDVYRLVSPQDDLAIAGDHIASYHLITQLGDESVDCDATGLDQSVRFPTRADPMLRKEFIDAECFSHRGASLFSELDGPL